MSPQLPSSCPWLSAFGQHVTEAAHCAVTCHVSSDLERLFHESFYPAVSIHQFSGRNYILRASVFQLGQKAQGSYFSKGDTPEEKYQCDSVFSWLA